MAESIKKAEEAFFEWMASTRTGSIFKVALGAVLVWVLDAAANWDIPAWAMIALVAVVPMIINEINPKDHRYGVGVSEG